MSSERDKRALKRDLIRDLDFNASRRIQLENLSDTSSEYSLKSSSSWENLVSIDYFEEDDLLEDTVLHFANQNISKDKMSTFSAELAIRIIPEFDGTNNYSKFMDMCQYFYNQINVGTELEFFLQIIRLKLCGSAYETFKHKKFTDWESFQKELNSHYLCSKSIQQLQRELISLKQLSNESVRSFANKIEKILSELNEFEKLGSGVIERNSESALSVFVDGLYNHSLKIVIKSRNITKLNDAISLALQEENSFSQNSFNSQSNLNKPNYSQNYNSNNFSNNIRPANNFVRKFCSFCNISGHRLEECRSFAQKNQNFKPQVNKRSFEVVCKYCGVSGHVIENCFKKRRGESQNNHVRYFYGSNSNENSKNEMSSTEEMGVSGMNVTFAVDENLPVTLSQNKPCPCQSNNQTHLNPGSQ